MTLDPDGYCIHRNISLGELENPDKPGAFYTKSIAFNQKKHTSLGGCFMRNLGEGTNPLLGGDLYKRW